MSSSANFLEHIEFNLVLYSIEQLFFINMQKDMQNKIKWNWSCLVKEVEKALSFFSSSEHRSLGTSILCIIR